MREKEMRISRRKLIINLVLAIFVIGSGLAFVWEDTIVMNWLLMCIFFLCAYSVLKEKQYATFFFYISFFLFLLDTVFFGLFNSQFKYDFMGSGQRERNVLLCLGISILGVYLGSMTNIKFKIGHFGAPEEKVIKSYSLKMISDQMQSVLRGMAITFMMPELIVALSKAVFVQSVSYDAYSLEFSSSMPSIINWMALVSPLIFFFYLGSLPRKKKAIPACGFYIFIGVVSLFYGQRNVVVIRFLVLISYFLIRNHNDRWGEIWITKRQLRLLVILAPLGIAFMSFWGSFRNGNDYNSTGILDSALDGLLTQGNCISILDFQFRYGGQLQDKPYAIGGIISFLHNNIIGRMIGLQSIPAKANTVETALYGYNYSCALMYVENQRGYLLGFGIGSCFIAELLQTFGYVGILLGSMVYGAVMNKLTKMKPRGFITNGFALLMIQTILLSPRASYDGFISGTFQVANLFMAFILWGLNRFVWPEVKDE